jgi:hypothetical protein
LPSAFWQDYYVGNKSLNNSKNAKYVSIKNIPKIRCSNEKKDGVIQMFHMIDAHSDNDWSIKSCYSMSHAMILRLIHSYMMNKLPIDLHPKFNAENICFRDNYIGSHQDLKEKKLSKIITFVMAKVNTDFKVRPTNGINLMRWIAKILIKNGGLKGYLRNAFKNQPLEAFTFKKGVLVNPVSLGMAIIPNFKCIQCRKCLALNSAYNNMQYKNMDPTDARCGACGYYLCSPDTGYGKIFDMIDTLLKYMCGVAGSKLDDLLTTLCVDGFDDLPIDAKMTRIREDIAILRRCVENYDHRIINADVQCNEAIMNIIDNEIPYVMTRSVMHSAPYGSCINSLLAAAFVDVSIKLNKDYVINDPEFKFMEHGNTTNQEAIFMKHLTYGKLEIMDKIMQGAVFIGPNIKNYKFAQSEDLYDNVILDDEYIIMKETNYMLKINKESKYILGCDIIKLKDCILVKKSTNVMAGISAIHYTKHTNVDTQNLIINDDGDDSYTMTLPIPDKFSIYHPITALSIKPTKVTIYPKLLHVLCVKNITGDVSPATLLSVAATWVNTKYGEARNIEENNIKYTDTLMQHVFVCKMVMYNINYTNHVNVNINEIVNKYPVISNLVGSNLTDWTNVIMTTLYNWVDEKLGVFTVNNIKQLLTTYKTNTVDGKVLNALWDNMMTMYTKPSKRVATVYNYDTQLTSDDINLRCNHILNQLATIEGYMCICCHRNNATREDMTRCKDCCPTQLKRNEFNWDYTLGQEMIKNKITVTNTQNKTKLPIGLSGAKIETTYNKKEKPKVEIKEKEKVVELNQFMIKLEKLNKMKKVDNKANVMQDIKQQFKTDYSNTLVQVTNYLDVEFIQACVDYDVCLSRCETINNHIAIPYLQTESIEVIYKCKYDVINMKDRRNDGPLTCGHSALVSAWGACNLGEIREFIQKDDSFSVDELIKFAQYKNKPLAVVNEETIIAYVPYDYRSMHIPCVYLYGSKMNSLGHYVSATIKLKTCMIDSYLQYNKSITREQRNKSYFAHGYDTFNGIDLDADAKTTNIIIESLIQMEVNYKDTLTNKNLWPTMNEIKSGMRLSNTDGKLSTNLLAGDVNVILNAEQCIKLRNVSKYATMQDYKLEVPTVALLNELETFSDDCKAIIEIIAYNLGLAWQQRVHNLNITNTDKYSVYLRNANIGTIICDLAAPHKSLDLVIITIDNNKYARVIKKMNGKIMCENLQYEGYATLYLPNASTGSMWRRLTQLLLHYDTKIDYNLKWFNKDSFAGTGKSQWIVNNMGSNDLAVAMTGGAVKSMRAKALTRKLNDGINLNVLSIDYINAASGVKCDRVFIDEASQLRLIDIIPILRSGCKEIYCLGDNDQISVVDMDKYEGGYTNFNLLDVSIKIGKVIDMPTICYRIGKPLSDILCLDSIVKNKVDSWSKYNTEYVLKQYNTPVTGDIVNALIELYRPDMIICIYDETYQVVKDHVKLHKMNIKCDTVHSYQGGSEESVIFIQEGKGANWGLAGNRKYIISALTRASKLMVHVVCNYYVSVKTWVETVTSSGGVKTALQLLMMYKDEKLTSLLKLPEAELNSLFMYLIEHPNPEGELLSYEKVGNDLHIKCKSGEGKIKFTGCMIINADGVRLTTGNSFFDYAIPSSVQQMLNDKTIGQLCKLEDNENMDDDDVEFVDEEIVIIKQQVHNKPTITQVTSKTIPEVNISEDLDQSPYSRKGVKLHTSNVNEGDLRYIENTPIVTHSFNDYAINNLNILEDKLPSTTQIRNIAYKNENAIKNIKDDISNILKVLTHKKSEDKIDGMVEMLPSIEESSSVHLNLDQFSNNSERYVTSSISSLQLSRQVQHHLNFSISSIRPPYTRIVNGYIQTYYTPMNMDVIELTQEQVMKHYAYCALLKSNLTTTSFVVFEHKDQKYRIITSDGCLSVSYMKVINMSTNSVVLYSKVSANFKNTIKIATNNVAMDLYTYMFVSCGNNQVDNMFTDKGYYKFASAIFLDRIFDGLCSLISRVIFSTSRMETIMAGNAARSKLVIDTFKLHEICTPNIGYEIKQHFVAIDNTTRQTTLFLPGNREMKVFVNTIVGMLNVGSILTDSIKNNTLVDRCTLVCGVPFPHGLIATKTPMKVHLDKNTQVGVFYRQYVSNFADKMSTSRSNTIYVNPNLVESIKSFLDVGNNDMKICTHASLHSNGNTYDCLDSILINTVGKMKKDITLYHLDNMLLLEAHNMMDICYSSANISSQLTNYELTLGLLKDRLNQLNNNRAAANLNKPEDKLAMYNVIDIKDSRTNAVVVGVSIYAIDLNVLKQWMHNEMHIYCVIPSNCDEFGTMHNFSDNLNSISWNGMQYSFKVNNVMRELTRKGCYVMDDAIYVMEVIRCIGGYSICRLIKSNERKLTMCVNSFIMGGRYVNVLIPKYTVGVIDRLVNEKVMELKKAKISTFLYNKFKLRCFREQCTFNDIIAYARSLCSTQLLQNAKLNYIYEKDINVIYDTAVYTYLDTKIGYSTMLKETNWIDDIEGYKYVKSQVMSMMPLINSLFGYISDKIEGPSVKDMLKTHGLSGDLKNKAIVQPYKVKNAFYKVDLDAKLSNGLPTDSNIKRDDDDSDNGSDMDDDEHKEIGRTDDYQTAKSDLESEKSTDKTPKNKVDENISFENATEQADIGDILLPDSDDKTTITKMLCKDSMSYSCASGEKLSIGAEPKGTLQQCLSEIHSLVSMRLKDKNMKYIIEKNPKPMLSDEQYNIMYEVFDRFINVMHREKLYYAIQAGVALSAIYHNCIFRWDADIDVFMCSCSYNKFIKTEEYDMYYYTHPTVTTYYHRLTYKLKYHVNGVFPCIDISIVNMCGNCPIIYTSRLAIYEGTVLISTINNRPIIVCMPQCAIKLYDGFEYYSVIPTQTFDEHINKNTTFNSECNKLKLLCRRLPVHKSHYKYEIMDAVNAMSAFENKVQVNSYQACVFNIGTAGDANVLESIVRTLLKTGLTVMYITNSNYDHQHSGLKIVKVKFDINTHLNHYYDNMLNGTLMTETPKELYESLMSIMDNNIDTANILFTTAWTGMATYIYNKVCAKVNYIISPSPPISMHSMDGVAMTVNLIPAADNEIGAFKMMEKLIGDTLFVSSRKPECKRSNQICLYTKWLMDNTKESNLLQDQIFGYPLQSVSNMGMNDQQFNTIMYNTQNQVKVILFNMSEFHRTIIGTVANALMAISNDNENVVVVLVIKQSKQLEMLDVLGIDTSHTYVKLSNNLHLFDRLEFSLALNYVDIMVHHGGSGTMHLCISKNVVNVIFAINGDQVFHANKINGLIGGGAYYLTGMKRFNIDPYQLINQVISKFDAYLQEIKGIDYAIGLDEEKLIKYFDKIASTHSTHVPTKYGRSVNLATRKTVNCEPKLTVREISKTSEIYNPSTSEGCVYKCCKFFIDNITKDANSYNEVNDNWINVNVSLDNTIQAILDVGINACVHFNNLASEIIIDVSKPVMHVEITDMALNYHCSLVDTCQGQIIEYEMTKNEEFTMDQMCNAMYDKLKINVNSDRMTTLVQKYCTRNNDVLLIPVKEMKIVNLWATAANRDYDYSNALYIININNTNYDNVYVINKVHRKVNVLSVQDKDAYIDCLVLHTENFSILVSRTKLTMGRTLAINSGHNFFAIKGSMKYKLEDTTKDTVFLNRATEKYCNAKGLYKNNGGIINPSSVTNMLQHVIITQYDNRSHHNTINVMDMIKPDMVIIPMMVDIQSALLELKSTYNISHNRAVIVDCTLKYLIECDSEQLAHRVLNILNDTLKAEVSIKDMTNLISSKKVNWSLYTAFASTFNVHNSKLSIKGTRVTVKYEKIMQVEELKGIVGADAATMACQLAGYKLKEIPTKTFKALFEPYDPNELYKWTFLVSKNCCATAHPRKKSVYSMYNDCIVTVIDIGGAFIEMDEITNKVWDKTEIQSADASEFIIGRRVKSIEHNQQVREAVDKSKIFEQINALSKTNFSDEDIFKINVIKDDENFISMMYDDNKINLTNHELCNEVKCNNTNTITSMWYWDNDDFLTDTECIGCQKVRVRLYPYKVKERNIYTYSDKLVMTRATYPNKAYGTFYTINERLTNKFHLRSGDVPKYMDTFRRICKVYFIDKHKDLAINFSKNKVGTNSELSKQWVLEHPNPDIKMAQLEHMFNYILLNKDFESALIHGKSEVLVKKTEILDDVNSISRVIVALSYAVSAIYCPIFQELKSRLKMILSDRIKYTDSMSYEDLSKYVGSIQGVKYMLENDLKKQDACTDEHILEVESILYAYLGMDKSMGELWRLISMNWRFRANGVMGYVDGKRKTGDPATAISNLITNLQVSLEYIEPNLDKFVNFLCLGDDGLAMFSALPNIKNLGIKIKNMYNMQSEYKISDKVSEFLRLLVVKYENQLYLVPNVVRIRNKFMISDTMNKFNYLDVHKSRVMSYMCSISSDVKTKEINDKLKLDITPTLWYDSNMMLYANMTYNEMTENNIAEVINDLNNMMLSGPKFIYNSKVLNNDFL